MDPIKVAFVGAGRRAWDVYFRLLPKLKEFFELVAVCDRQPAAAKIAAERLGVPAVGSLRELVSARPMEAVIYATPPESHHAISVYLSRHGLHHVCETPMAAALSLGHDMISQARAHGVVLHVNEQFPRLPLIAFTRKIIAEGVIGQVGRITSYHGHTGYHNNSIWQLYGGGKPSAVNAVAHTMGVRRHLDGAGRWQESEPFHLRVLHFASGLLGVDMAGNIKSALGRCPRPGYLEIDGAAGAIVAQPYDDRPAPWNGRAEVRLVPEEDLTRGAYAESFPIERVTMVGHRVNITEQLPHGGEYWKLRCRLPDRMLEYDNPLLDWGVRDGYLASVGQCLLDFHGQVRRGAQAWFSAEMAAASAEMEYAFARSAKLAGARVELPVRPEAADEQRALAALRERFGVDPMDVEAVMDLAFPANYVPEAASPFDPRGRGESPPGPRQEERQ